MIIYSIMCKSSSFILYTKSQNTISAFQGFIWAFTQVLCVQVQVQEAASEPKTPALQDNSDCVDKLIINNHKSEMIYLSLHFLPAFFQLNICFLFVYVCGTDTNVIRYIQLTEMKIRRNAQREKSEVP